MLNNCAMQYVVVDTNVIVSALLAKDISSSVPFSILAAVFSGKITPIVSKAILNEYALVLNREKFGFDKNKIRVLLSEFEKLSLKIIPSESGVQLPDAKDVCFYNVAFAYKEYDVILVTGNMKHFPNCNFSMTPSQLKEKLGL